MKNFSSDRRKVAIIFLDLQESPKYMHIQTFHLFRFLSPCGRHKETLCIFTKENRRLLAFRPFIHSVFPLSHAHSFLLSWHYPWCPLFPCPHLTPGARPQRGICSRGCDLRGGCGGGAEAGRPWGTPPRFQMAVVSDGVVEWQSSPPACLAVLS